MFFVYILYSAKIDKYYIGSTQNPYERLKKHNTNHKGFTGKTNDWKIVYKEEFNSKAEAMKREYFIKNKKSRKFILNLIDTYNNA